MRKRKTYSKEFKEEAIRLVKEDGLTCIQVERDLGIGHGVFCQAGGREFQSRHSRHSKKSLSLKRRAFLLYIPPK